MKKFTLLFALLCASVMGWAGTKYCNYEMTAGGHTVYFSAYKVSDGNYQIKITSADAMDGLSAGCYMHVNGAAGYQMLPHSTVSGDKKTITVDIAGTPGTIYNPLYIMMPGEVTFTAVQNVDIDWENTCESGGGGSTPDPDPAPAGINWGEISWLVNASGNAAYTNKYKALAGDPGPSNIDVIQSPGWATKPGLYMTFPNADFRNFSLPASCYSIQGAGIVFHMDAFTAKETTVHVNVGGTVRSFTIYYEDGTETPAEIYDVNFALADNGSSATASSGTAGNAIDGNNGTRWESASSDPQTLTLDLGQKRIFNTVQIRWEGAYAKTFTIEVSNDAEAWTTVKTVTDQSLAGFPYEQNLEFEKTTARYVRFNGTARGTGYGYSFWEFRVLLPGVSTLTSISLNAAGAMAEVGGAGVALTAQPKGQNGNNMEAEVSYEITPAAAGHMSGNTFIPDQIGTASIRAYNGEIYSPAVTVVAYTGSNVALEKDVEASGYDTEANLYPSFAVDNNEGSLWSARVGETGDLRVYDAWIIVDLGAFYDINLIAIRWEGACSKHYHVDFSADNSTWRTAYNAGWNATATHWEYLSGTAEDATKVRYVRVWSTEAVSHYGIKIMDLKVFGIDWVPSGDTEAPVMTSASLVSSTFTSAIIAVAATDEDGEVARYHVVDATNGIDANYVPEAGNITITGLTHATAYNFTITAEDLANHESENSIVVPVTTPFDVTINLALNKDCEGGYYDNNPAESDDKANDGNNNTQWTTYGDHAIALDWWVVDLGEIYNLTNITIVWGDQYATNYILQARVEAPSADDKANDAAWVTLATVTDAAANAEKSTNVSGIGRYLRFRALAHTGFMRLKEFRAYASGIAESDTEKPVMTSASLVSNTDVQAVISVAATDNNMVAKYRVTDAGNSIDAYCIAEAGNITVAGLTQGTHYTFTIKAVDLFGNESANSQSVEVTTSAHYTEPQEACASPTWDASLVKAMYSPTYSADCGLGEWGSGTTVTNDTYGKKYTVGPNGAGGGYFGMVDFALNCLLMEKLHFDIWVEEDMSIRFVPIWGGGEQGITKNLVGQEWNSIDIDLTAYTGITNWGNITQMKLDEMQHNFNLWIANAYFYREAAYVDNVAPTNVSASVTAEGFYSVKISARAEDNSGAVSFKVMSGEEILATGAAATGVATTITVNNLNPGTAYNFNVVAYDEANNAAAPVAVAATTKSVPASAPAPVTSGKVIVPVYSDALAGSKTGIQSGNWGETTVYEWLQIAPNDQVFYAQNFNYAGWHSWGASINATDMTYLHVDFYSTGMTQVSVTPISPGHEGAYAVALTANTWTSVDVPLSSYSGIDWSDIFQFKFMSPVGGNELMIDNVYFWSYGVTTNQDNWSTFASAVNVQVPSGITAYKAAYSNSNGDEVLTLTALSDGIIPANEGVILKSDVAETTHIFTPTATAAATDMGDNSLTGCVTRTDVSSVRATKDIFCMRYSGSYDMTGFFLYEGQYVPAGKAYLPLAKTGPSSAPRKVRFVINNEQTTTGIEKTGADAVEATKYIENGQLFIHRGEAVYTIEGVRVK